jgi:hypothetical protein
VAGTIVHALTLPPRANLREVIMVGIEQDC